MSDEVIKENKGLFSEFPEITTQEWEEKILQDLKGAEYEKKLIWNTYEGLKIKPYYRSEHKPDVNYLFANPGEYPFVRGYKSENNWNICESIIVDNPGQANNEALHAVERGADSVAFSAKNMDYYEELEALLKNLDFKKTKIHFTSANSYSILADLLIEFIKKNNLNPAELHGSFNFDSISFYLLNGYYYNSCEDNFNEAATLIKYSTENLSGFRVININGQHFYNSGANTVQELAYALASSSEYLSRLTDKGLSVDEICSKMQVTFAIGSNYFFEIAKLRAFRILWTILLEQYGAKDHKSYHVPIHATSGLWNKTVFDPYVNMLRLTTECMAAAIGGAETITLLPFTNTFKKYDDFSQRVSRNIQNILKEESYLDKVSDPAAGSYYLEQLTHQLAETAWDKFCEIESTGGMLAFIESNSLKNEIESVANQRNMDIAMRKTPILGTNIFPNLSEKMLDEINLQSKKAEKPHLKTYRGSEIFEDIRLATEKYIKEGNPVPKVFLVTYGNLAMRKARATFTSNFFGCAGFDISEEHLSSEIDHTLTQIGTNKPNIVVICSSDDEYGTYAPDLAEAIKKEHQDIFVIIAGFPKDLIEILKNKGVDDFIHVRVNIVETLQKYLGKLNII